MFHVSLTYNNPFQSRFCCLTHLEGFVACVIVSLYSYKYLQRGKLSKSYSMGTANKMLEPAQTLKPQITPHNLQDGVIAWEENARNNSQPASHLGKCWITKAHDSREQCRVSRDAEISGSNSLRLFTGRCVRSALSTPFPVMFTRGIRDWSHA